MKGLGFLTGKLARKRWTEWLVLLSLGGAWNALFIPFALRRHAAFNTGFDLAVFAQLLWTTLNGAPFFTSLIAESTNFLGYHFSPLLAVLLPLYAVWSDARMLLVAQPLVLSAGAFVLYRFARRRLGFVSALVWVLAYLLYPPLHYLALNDFHDIVLAVPLLFVAAWGALERRYRAMMVGLALAALVKEEVAFITVGFGTFVWWFQRQRRAGKWLTLGGLAWTATLFGFLMPWLSTTGRSFVFINRYSALGGSPAEIVSTLIFSPTTVLGVLAEPQKLLFLFQLLLPLGGLPLLGRSGLWLPVPVLGYLLLSNYEFHYAVEHHYTAPLIPLLFANGVVGFEWLHTRLRARQRGLAWVPPGLLLLGALVSTWLWSPLPGMRAYRPELFDVRPEHRVWADQLKALPAQAAIVADWDVLPHVVNRFLVDVRHRPPFLLIDPDRVPDYIVAHRLPPEATVAPMYPWVLAAPDGAPIRVPQFDLWAELPEGLDIWQDRGRAADVWLTPLNVPFKEGITLAGARVEQTPSRTLRVWLAWRTWAPVAERVKFTVHLVNAAGEHVAQVDKEVGDGRFPTTLWRTWVTDPLVVDVFELSSLEALSPGTYQVVVGAYVADPFRVVARLDGETWYSLGFISLGNEQ